jgi:hypothetical protein
MIYSEQAPLEIFFRKSHPCDYKEVHEGTPEWLAKRPRDRVICYVWYGGARHFMLGDELHREDGPAVIWADGEQEWWINDQRHNINGPARKSKKGEMYYLNGIFLSKEAWEIERESYVCQEIKDLVI